MVWAQNYNPLGNVLLSTLAALAPVFVLFGAIVLLKVRIHYAALFGLAAALLVALLVCGMPLGAASGATIFGAGYGLFPIGWIILNLIFLYQLTVKKGWFEVLRRILVSLAPDPRIQVVLIAFSLGAFFEGAAGFGTPVAVTAVILIQLGFKPLEASGLSLIANTAPVAYAGLGTPIIALSKVTGLDELALSGMVGRQLPFFSVLIPFWMLWVFAGFRGMLGVWPVALAAGVGFAIPQFMVSNFHGPWLVDIVASLVSMAAILVVLKFWQPAEKWKPPGQGQSSALTCKCREDEGLTSPQPLLSRDRILDRCHPASDRGGLDPTMRPEKKTPPVQGKICQAWLPWALLTALVFLWGIPAVKNSLDRISVLEWQVPRLHGSVVRAPPIVPTPTAGQPTKPEEAVFRLNWISATGTAIFLAACLAGVVMGFTVRELLQTYWETVVQVRFSLLTVAAMFALGYVLRYSGTDATVGLAMARTGVLYPFFGTWLGWIGVALTGSDTASNVLFGSLQKITAQQLGLSPVLMAAANTSGGMVGKMINAQSIVVASTATNWYGHEREILRYVFFHSLALAWLVASFVFLQACFFGRS